MFAMPAGLQLVCNGTRDANQSLRYTVKKVRKVVYLGVVDEGGNMYFLDALFTASRRRSCPPPRP
jgi:hypothetical protein